MNEKNMFGMCCEQRTHSDWVGLLPRHMRISTAGSDHRVSNAVFRFQHFQIPLDAHKQGREMMAFICSSSLAFGIQIYWYTALEHVGSI